MDESKIVRLWIELLREIDDNPVRRGLNETPIRIAKMYTEVFGGYDESRSPEITVFPNGEDGILYSGMIIDIGYFFSFCEHHVIPFFGSYFYGYIPDKSIIGASKVARVVDFYSARLQVQERLCVQIVDYIEGIIEPKGSILIMRGRHLCKEMRGVKKFNSSFETNEVRGYFGENKDGCKDEFIARIGSGV